MLRQIWVRLVRLIGSEGAGGGAQEDAHIWWWYHCATSNITLSWRHLMIISCCHPSSHTVPFMIFGVVGLRALTSQQQMNVQCITKIELFLTNHISVEVRDHLGLLWGCTAIKFCPILKSWKGRRAAWGCYDIHASYILRRFLPPLMHLWMPGRDWRQISMKCKLRCTKWLSTSQVKGSGQGICNYVLF